MKVYLTGGTGFLGARIIQYLLNDPAVDGVVTLHRDENKKRMLENFLGDKPELSFIKGDLTDSGIGGSGCDVLVHAAAMRNISACEKDNQQARRINVDGTRNLFSDASAAGVRKVVFFSSQSVYSLSEETLYTEDVNPGPRTYYGKTKLAGEQLARESGMEYIIFRPSRIIGPGIFQNTDNFISFIMPEKILDSREISLFGHIYKKYNCIDNRDCAVALSSVLVCGEAWNQTYNLSNDSGISMNEINELYSSMVKKGTYRTLYFDIVDEESEILIPNGKLRNVVGWRPVYKYEDSLRDRLIERAAESGRVDCLDPKVGIRE
ncbi:MAG: NAD(P)-dependent oxidoreductase [Clostridia bacterium]